MDIYTTAFTYPRRQRHLQSTSSSLEFHTHGQRHGLQGNGFHGLMRTSLSQPNSNANLHDSYNASHSSHYLPQASSSIDNNNVGNAAALQKLAVTIMSNHGCQVTYAEADHGRGWSFQLAGAYPSVISARAMILKDCPVQHRSAIRVPRSEILDGPSSAKPSLKPEVRRRLDEIASLTQAHIAVVNSPLALSNRTPPSGVSSSAGWSGLETERVCELVITGDGDSVDVARVRLLVMLDELSGLHAELCELDHKLHAIIFGRKRAVLQQIQEETATNIYCPSPLTGLVGPEIGGPAKSNSSVTSLHPPVNVIWITGEYFGVQRARDMLFQVSINKSKSVISRDANIVARKLDWMLTDRTEDLKAIMSDNATFIQFPPIGSTISAITVYGDHRVNIQRTIRSIMQLACQYYLASIWLLPTQYNALLPPPSLNAAQVNNLLYQVSIQTGCEIVYKASCFEVHGIEHDVRAAVSMILDLDVIKAYHHEIRFSLELSNEHREFISGKKNGKINKIMQTVSVKIKFETFNEYNFLIEVAGPDASVLQGLSLLQEELPAEISFHVPEAYHKRIIGVGGRSIQRIMKKYGVYVKFSNAEEFAALGGYNDNEDNVVARTPTKNAINLDNLKQAVMELVVAKDKDYVNETVSIPRRYHRTLLGEKCIFIHDIEGKTNSRVRFPDKETASDVVTIFGPESQVQIAAAMLLEHVPFEADMTVPMNPDLPRLCASSEFVAFADRIKHDFNVSIVPNIRASQGMETQAEYSFKFRCQRSNSDFLINAREMLEQFLLNHNIHVYPSATVQHIHKRGDSFADAFPHFDSKVLSTAKNHSMDMGRPDMTHVERRLRMASSSPDVKALFHAPAYIYNLDEQEDIESPYINDQWTPLSPIGSGIPSRKRHVEEHVKRGSDSHIETKMKEHLGNHLVKPKSLQNRAQSLDLTHSLSRIAEASSRSHMTPDSPTTSTGDLDSLNGDGSTPGSATAPSFPSVYGSSMVGTTSQRLGKHVQSQSNVEEVSRMINKLGL